MEAHEDLSTFRTHKYKKDWFYLTGWRTDHVDDIVVFEWVEVVLSLVGEVERPRLEEGEEERSKEEGDVVQVHGEMEWDRRVDVLW